MKLAVVAGCACSVASALGQQYDLLQPVRDGRARATRPTAPTPTVVLRDAGTVNPIKVEVNGVEVPFELSGGATDSNAMLYDNRSAANNFTSPMHQYRTMDDFGFAGAQTAVVTGIVPSWGTPAAPQFPLENVTVEFQFFGTFNPAVTPVNGPPASNSVRVTYAFPAGTGWAPNAIYTGGSFIFASAGNNITVSGGAVDVRILRPVTAAFAPHPDFDPALNGAGPVMGTSTDSVYFDLNGDNIYQGTDAGAGNEATNFGGGPGQLANLRLAIQGRFLEPTAGACCLPDGACVILTASQCSGLAGTYNGDGSTCASVPGHCATGPVLHNNGTLITGTTTLSGVPAPAGTFWAEGAQDQQPCSTSINGPNISGTFRIADDFTVPSGKQWAVNNLTIYGYASPGTTTTSPVSGITLRVWDGPPNNPGSAIVFGDTTTNLYPTATASFTNIYRIFNTGVLAQIPGTTRPIWQFRIPLSLTLPAGSYWIDYSVTGGPFGPQLTLMTSAANGVRNMPHANALQFLAAAPVPNTGSTWQLIGDNGFQAGCLAGNYDMPFIVEGAETNVGGGCYANCDESTQAPVLNVADFGCFLTRYAAGDAYANCDDSTQPPVLNVADFGCFLTKYAAGCP